MLDETTWKDAKVCVRLFCVVWSALLHNWVTDSFNNYAQVMDLLQNIVALKIADGTSEAEGFKQFCM